MDIEKILTLVAIVVYGLVNIVLSIVRTLKTSRISSEVKSVIPSVDKKSSGDETLSGDEQTSLEQPSGDDKKERESASLDDLLISLAELTKKNYTDK